MRFKFLLLVVVASLAFTGSVFAQIATKSGTLYGKVVDDKGAPLPGVIVTLESDVIQPQMATTGPSGGFRFANLPPGLYSATFAIEGFAEVRQEDVRISVGGSIELTIKMKPALVEQFVVLADTPVVNTRKTGNESTFTREYLEDVPSGRDPWVLIEQTPGVDNDRINIAGSESGQQTGFFARGSSDAYNAWNYDGVNATDPIAAGASPSYYDFDAFEEVQIQSGGADASIGSSGVVVNLVTKRPGNKWEANVSGYFVNDSLQSDNTPDEVASLPPVGGQSGQQRSNQIDQVYDYGFDIGGPVVKDRLFVWGAYRKNQIDLITRTIDPITGINLFDRTTLEDWNFKANFNANAANESQFGYFNGTKDKDGRGFNPPIQAQETLWTQGSPGTILEGIWTGQHTWIPNDRMIFNGRYGYIGNSFSLVPNEGDCPPAQPCAQPMIFLSAIPRYEQTAYNVNPIDRPTHDFNVDLNYFREQTLGGDHEFKFGFEYKFAKGHTFSSYGNGVYLYDYYQTVPNGPLTSGFGLAQHAIDGNVQYTAQSFYATDTFRTGRLTLNLGLRVDTGSGENKSSSIPGVPGFEDVVGAFNFPGNDRSPRFTDVSPRLGATVDVTGDGKTIVRGNYARYYNGYTAPIDTYANPTYVYNGGIFTWENSNGDRVITRDEITFCCDFFGGLVPGGFDLAAFDALKKIDADLDSEVVDEFILGFEREILRDLSVAVTYTHRDYKNFQADVPFGVEASDWVPGGVIDVDTALGNFTVPYSVLGFEHDGTHILTNVDGYSNAYNGVDLVARKRMSNSVMLNASVTLQRQKANLDGSDGFLGTGFPFQGDGLSGVVFIDPTQASIYDDQPYAFVSGGSGKTGVFPYAEWTARFSGVYQLPWDASIGAFMRYQQGYPLPLFYSFTDTTLSAFYGTRTRNVLLEPIGERRYDNIFTLDLNFRKSFDLGDAGRITGQVDIFNLTNANTVIQRERRTHVATFNVLQENLSPRAVRLGMKYSF